MVTGCGNPQGFLGMRKVGITMSKIFSFNMEDMPEKPIKHLCGILVSMAVALSEQGFDTEEVYEIMYKLAPFTFDPHSKSAESMRDVVYKIQETVGGDAEDFMNFLDNLRRHGDDGDDSEDDEGFGAA